MTESLIVFGMLAAAAGIGFLLLRRGGDTAAPLGPIGSNLMSGSAVALGTALVVLSAVAGQDEHALSTSLGRDSDWYGRVLMAENGDPVMQKHVGDQFYYGHSPFARSYADAADWYRRSARRGHGQAMLALASQYEVGEGVDRNLPLAELWYRKAERAGFTSAMLPQGADGEQGVPIP